MRSSCTLNHIDIIASVLDHLLMVKMTTPLTFMQNHYLLAVLLFRKNLFHMANNIRRLNWEVESISANQFQYPWTWYM